MKYQKKRQIQEEEEKIKNDKSKRYRRGGCENTVDGVEKGIIKR